MSADTCGKGVEKHRLTAALRKSYLAKGESEERAFKVPLFSCGSQVSLRAVQRDHSPGLNAALEPECAIYWIPPGSNTPQSGEAGTVPHSSLSLISDYISYYMGQKL